MRGQPPSQVRFGPFVFYADTRELFREGEPVGLAPKASLVLAALLGRPGRLVSREELYEAAWSDTVVEFDQGLNTCIRQIRAALDDDARDPTWIETVPRRGYRFRRIAAAGSAVGRSDGTRRDRFPAGAVGRAAAVAVALVVGLFVGRGSEADPASPWAPAVTVAGFRGIEASGATAGLDVALQRAVETSLRRRGATGSGARPGYILTGVVVPAERGALLQATLLRASDGAAVWTGRYNPLCPEIEGDAVGLIAELLARSVVAEADARG